MEPEVSSFDLLEEPGQVQATGLSREVEQVKLFKPEDLPQDVPLVTRKIRFYRYLHSVDDMSLQGCPIDAIHDHLKKLVGSDQAYMPVGTQYRIRCDLTNAAGRIELGYSDLKPRDRLDEPGKRYGSPIGKNQGLAKKAYVRLFPDGHVGILSETRHLTFQKVADYLRVKVTLPQKMNFAGFAPLCLGDPVKTLKEAHQITSVTLRMRRTPEDQATLFEEASSRGIYHVVKNYFAQNDAIDQVEVTCKIDTRRKLSRDKSLDPQESAKEAEFALKNLEMIEELRYSCRDQDGQSQEIPVFKDVLFVEDSIPVDSHTTNSVQPLAAFNAIERAYEAKKSQLSRARLIL